MYIYKNRLVFSLLYQVIVNNIQSSYYFLCSIYLKFHNFNIPL